MQRLLSSRRPLYSCFLGIGSYVEKPWIPWYNKMIDGHEGKEREDENT